MVHNRLNRLAKYQSELAPLMETFVESFTLFWKPSVGVCLKLQMVYGQQIVVDLWYEPAKVRFILMDRISGWYSA